MNEIWLSNFFDVFNRVVSLIIGIVVLVFATFQLFKGLVNFAYIFRTQTRTLIVGIIGEESKFIFPEARELLYDPSKSKLEIGIKILIRVLGGLFLIALVIVIWNVIWGVR